MAGYQEESFGRLLDVLEQCRYIYEELIETAQHKTSLIIAENVKALEELNAKESELLSRFIRLDESRKQAVADLQRDLACPVDEQAPLSEVRQILVSETQRKKLQDMQEQLAVADRTLQTLNERNQVLLKQGAALLNDLLDLFLGQVEGQYGYDHPEAASTESRRSKGVDIRT